VIYPRMQKVILLQGYRSSRCHAKVVSRLKRQSELPTICSLVGPEETMNCEAISNTAGGN
jgi:hypothetical protein